MKIRDTLRLSLHGMWNNKTMTILVICVMLILSLLVTSILGITVEFVRATNIALNKNEKRIDLHISRYMYEGKYDNLSDDDIHLMQEIYNNNRHLFNSMYASCAQGKYDYSLEDKGAYLTIKFTDASSNFIDGNGAKLISGRLWSRDDIGKKHIWVSKQFALSTNVSVGDNIRILQYDRMATESNSKYDYLICGIVDNEGKDMRYMDYNAIMLLDSVDILGDKLTSMTIESTPYVGSTMSEVRYVEKIVNEYNEIDKNNLIGRSVRSSKVDEVKTIIMMSTIIIAVVLIFVIVIILLSIGCIANAIQITVEENRKFFGMMKAIGMTNGNIKAIVRWQAVFMIAIAVIIAAFISIGIVAAAEPAVLDILDLTEDMFHIGLPFYVPIIIFAFETTLVVLFTNKSLGRLNHMDVISVISEVD